jgi:uncharacterized protein (DUF1697 family)
MNCQMPELRAAFEAAGFRDVKTVIASGNVVFSTTKASPATLAKRCEAAMAEHMGKSFATIIRSVDALQAMLDADPFARFTVTPKSKRIVTFLGGPLLTLPTLPLTLGSAAIHAIDGEEAFSTYVPGDDKTPLFMTLIEKTFGKAVTTRTWETVLRIARA